MFGRKESVNITRRVRVPADAIQETPLHVTLYALARLGLGRCMGIGYNAMRRGLGDNYVSYTVTVEYADTSPDKVLVYAGPKSEGAKRFASFEWRVHSSASERFVEELSATLRRLRGYMDAYSHVMLFLGHARLRAGDALLVLSSKTAPPWKTGKCFPGPRAIRAVVESIAPETIVVKEWPGVRVVAAGDHYYAYLAIAANLSMVSEEENTVVVLGAEEEEGSQA